jgi:diguanylate cyclase (GGDEF)-like protein
LKPLQHPKLWVGAAVGLTAVLGLACAFLPQGLALTAVSDLVTGTLMLSALLAFAADGLACKGRLRWFWILQSAGWALWFSDQLVWIAYDLVLKKTMPPMSPADALLFLAGAPMLAGLLLRPHRQPTERSPRMGSLDFSLLLLWWLYLYSTFSVCWQYVSLNQRGYDLSFDVLTLVEFGLLTAAIVAFWRRSSGRWRTFYAWFFATVVVNGISFYNLNHALERGVYFTGSWYDIPYGASFAMFTIVAVKGRGLAPEREAAVDDSYESWMANLAMTAVLSLPVIAFFALLDPQLPPAAVHFRVLVTLVTVFVMALLLFIQHHRLNRELRHTNVVLEEASLTDPLTGLRNRRYFSATIEADVSQTLRSYADGHDPHTRDLVFYLIDVDNFKEINDRYGHDTGDKVLVEMTHRLSSSIRHSDVLMRWGGEEFLIVSRYTDRREAELLAQRVLAAVADTPFALNRPDETISRTCSLGWAAFPWFADDPRAIGYDEVLTLADRGLNQAKQAGKNRAIGMMPATNTQSPVTTERMHSIDLSVAVLPVAGPAR